MTGSLPAPSCIEFGQVRRQIRFERNETGDLQHETLGLTIWKGIPMEIIPIGMLFCGMTISPGGEYALQEEDELVVLGRNEDIREVERL